MDIEMEFTAALSELAPWSASKIKPDASFLDDLGMDSLDTVELVMLCEERFDVEIPDDQAERLITVKDAVDFLKQYVPV